MKLNKLNKILTSIILIFKRGDLRGLYTKTFALSSISGALAGVTHGTCSVIIDTSTGRLRRQPAVLSISGTLAAHTISHTTLFTTYECWKEMFMQGFNADHTDYLGPILVAAAGGIAGLLEGLVSYYTVRWEEPPGVIGFRKLMTSVGIPDARLLLTTIPPAAVGFLAFEYGQELVLRKGETPEEEEIFPDFEQDFE